MEQTFVQLVYHFIFKPEEVAEVEVSIAQCDRGVTFTEKATCRADKAPDLQDRRGKRNSLKNSNLYKCQYTGGGGHLCKETKMCSQLI